MRGLSSLGLLIGLISFVLCHHYTLATFQANKSILIGGKNFREVCRAQDNALLFRLRGGVVKNTKKEALAGVKPATRAYLLLALFCTIIHMTGLPAPEIFNLDISKFYQIWRPFTAMAYFGAPSMSMATSIYFLINHGQHLETECGTGAFTWFLMVQTALLTALGVLLGFPFQAQAMIASAIYVNSRRDPMRPMTVQFGLKIVTWQLPFCMMAIDCLSQQSGAPAWPHIMGIFTGHIYYFFTTLWPTLGGKARLLPPQWIIDKLGDKPSSNIAGLDFRKKKTKPKSKKGWGGLFGSKSKGRKLG